LRDANVNACPTPSLSGWQKLAHRLNQNPPRPQRYFYIPSKHPIPPRFHPAPPKPAPVPPDSRAAPPKTPLSRARDNITDGRGVARPRGPDRSRAPVSDGKLKGPRVNLCPTLAGHAL